MTVKYVSLPLPKVPVFFYSVTLEGEYYILEFVYNERQKGYLLSLFDADKNPIVEGVGLVPNYPVMFNYVIPALTGIFWMETKADINIEQYKLYPEKVEQYYNFYYIYDE